MLVFHKQWEFLKDSEQESESGLASLQIDLAGRETGCKMANTEGTVGDLN